MTALYVTLGILTVTLVGALGALWVLLVPRYRVGDSVWCIGGQAEALLGKVTSADPRGYIVFIPSLSGVSPTQEYYASKEQARKSLRPRKEATS